ncbi:ATP synthase F1 subunit gamma [Candidatus Peribacteria bacterium]|nr:ATP synthase F1 subunit gamma [Candidatus Peribacteria bacterium]
MARNLRDIRRKMKAVKSTRQVTKAMELVAGSKMRRAVQNAQTLRQYADTAWRILERIGSSNAGIHEFFTEKPIENVLVLVISSDRGLCGSLNSHLFRTVAQYIEGVKNVPTFKNIEFVAVGRKGQQFLARTGHKIVAAFPAFSNHPMFRDILPVSKLVFDAFKKGQYDHVVVLYPSFVSALVQEPAAKALLPFSENELKNMALQLHSKKPKKVASKEHATTEFLFEPSSREVLNAILPQLTEIQIFQAILEACASEHSARMVAMRNASDSASDILDDLTLTYNQTRQAGITAELAELSAGAAALG